MALVANSEDALAVERLLVSGGKGKQRLAKRCLLAPVRAPAPRVLTASLPRGSRCTTSSSSAAAELDAASQNANFATVVRRGLLLPPDVQVGRRRRSRRDGRSGR